MSLSSKEPDGAPGWQAEQLFLLDTDFLEYTSMPSPECFPFQYAVSVILSGAASPIDLIIFLDGSDRARSADEAASHLNISEEVSSGSEASSPKCSLSPAITFSHDLAGSSVGLKALWQGAHSFSSTSFLCGA